MFILVYYIFSKYTIKHQNNITYTDIPLPTNALKISTKPFLLGLERKFISPEHFYFDNDFLYAVGNNKQIAYFPLKDICRLKKLILR